MRLYILGSALSLATCVTFAGEYVVVKKGDTLSGIAHSSNTSYQEICSLNKLLDCNKIDVGQRLQIPSVKQETKPQPQEQQEKPTSVANDSGPTDGGINEGGARVFRRPGAKPLCPTFKKDPKSCVEVFDKALVAEGLPEGAGNAVVESVVSGKATDENRPNGHTWERFISGQGDVWGTTEVGVPGGNVAVKACPLMGNKQVDVVDACGNLGINTVIVPEAPKEIAVVPEASPKEGGCRLDWLLMAQYARGSDMRNVSGRGETTCQFKVSDKMSWGPLGTLGGSVWRGGSWKEYAWHAGLGSRIEWLDTTGFEKIQLDLSFLYASTRGGDGENVRKPAIQGWDIGLNLHAKKYFSLGGSQDSEGIDQTPVSAEGISFSLTSGNSEEQENRVLGEFSLYGTVPITNTSGPVYWKDRIVDTDSRHAVAGVSARVGWELNGWEVIPEVELGAWHTFGIKKPWGLEFTVGVATRDRFARVHAGIGVADGSYGVVKAELNGGKKGLFASYQHAVDAVTNGATSSRVGLGLDPASEEVKNASPVRIVTAPMSETKPQPTQLSVKSRLTTSYSCEHGWGDATCFPTPAQSDLNSQTKTEVVEVSRPAANDSSFLAVSGWNG